MSVNSKVPERARELAYGLRARAGPVFFVFGHLMRARLRIVEVALR